MTAHVAKAESMIDADAQRVWAALTEPEQIAKYFFGTRVDTSWEPGEPITWIGEFEGKPYSDHGLVIAVEPGHRLELTHFSPMSGQPDLPENYHGLVFELTEEQAGTRVTLSQDNNSSAEEAEHSRANWQQVLDGLKKVVEAG